MVEEATNLDVWEAEFTRVIGKVMEVPTRCSASQDHILAFCDALGDNNPLWIDEEYARTGRFGMLTAPPTFLIKVNNLNTSHDLLASPLAPQLSLDGLSNLQAAIEFQWFRPIWAGDRFTARAKVVEITRRQTRSVGPSVWPVTEASYFNQRQELVGIIRQTMCVNNAAGRGGARPPEPDRPEIAAESADLLALRRKRRGAQPRYWQDVEVGQEMEPLEKGVFTVLEGARWDTNVHRLPRILSENGNVNSAGRTLSMPGEGPSLVRPDVPSGIALGPSQQKYGWLGQLLTDWMGDHGTLKKLGSQMRSQVSLGDAHVARGKIIKKYVEGGEHLVDCEMVVENQAGKVIAPGWATVALPAKE